MSTFWRHASCGADETCGTRLPKDGSEKCSRCLEEFKGNNLAIHTEAEVINMEPRSGRSPACFRHYSQHYSLRESIQGRLRVWVTCNDIILTTVTLHCHHAFFSRAREIDISFANIPCIFFSRPGSLLVAGGVGRGGGSGCQGWNWGAFNTGRQQQEQRHQATMFVHNLWNQAAKKSDFSTFSINLNGWLFNKCSELKANIKDIR